MQHLVRLNN